MIDARINTVDFVAMNRADLARRRRNREGRRKMPDPVPVSSLKSGRSGPCFTLRPTGERSLDAVRELHPTLVIFRKLQMTATRLPHKGPKYFAVAVAVNSTLAYPHAGEPGHPDGRVLIPADTPAYPIR